MDILTYEIAFFPFDICKLSLFCTPCTSHSLPLNYYLHSKLFNIITTTLDNLKWHMNTHSITFVYYLSTVKSTVVMVKLTVVLEFLKSIMSNYCKIPIKNTFISKTSFYEIFIHILRVQIGKKCPMFMLCYVWHNVMF